jgi:AGCS family alanine or glycine:cation symporter
MYNHIINYLNLFDTFFWGYIGFTLVLVLGLFLSFKMRFFQVFGLIKILKNFLEMSRNPTKNKKGLHPLRVFFSSVGGMVGIGNVIGIITAVQIGGPGALFWVWVAAPLGAIIKYSEIFLGIKHRVANNSGGYDGGPMYYLKHAFKSKSIPIIACILLCIYGVEIYQFKVVTDSISQNLNINPLFVGFIVLALVIYASKGGIARLSKVCSSIMPLFMGVYILMSLIVVGSNITILPAILCNVFKCAFSGNSAVGGFAGASIIITIKQGISRAVYSGDIGIGYDSIIQSETSATAPHKQALLGILGVFIDNLICSLSILVILVTNTWNLNISSGTELAQKAFSIHFPFMNVFMPLFLFFAGYTTIIAFFCVGIKCAKFINKKYGVFIYFIYAISSFVLFSFVDQTKALLIMSLSGGGLVFINLIAIFILRKQIELPININTKINQGEQNVSSSC